MAYRIIYCNKNRVRKYRLMTRKEALTFCGLVFIAAIIVLNIYGKDILHALIPGDPEITGQAFSQLADNLKSGEPLQQAVATFCKEIIENADLR